MAAGTGRFVVHPVLLVVKKNIRLPYNLGTDVDDFDSTKLSWIPSKSVVCPKLNG